LGVDRIANYYEGKREKEEDTSQENIGARELAWKRGGKGKREKAHAILPEEKKAHPWFPTGKKREEGGKPEGKLKILEAPGGLGLWEKKRTGEGEKSKTYYRLRHKKDTCKFPYEQKEKKKKHPAEREKKEMGGTPNI